MLRWEKEVLALVLYALASSFLPGTFSSLLLYATRTTNFVIIIIVMSYIRTNIVSLTSVLSTA
jgi:hypothetical protein